MKTTDQNRNEWNCSVLGRREAGREMVRDGFKSCRRLERSRVELNCVERSLSKGKYDDKQHGRLLCHEQATVTATWNPFVCKRE